MNQHAKDSGATKQANTAAEPFNVPALAQWLDAITPLELHSAADLTLTRVGNGQSNLTYLATDPAGSTCIVRRPPLGHLAASAHDVLREGRIMAALNGTRVPVPTIYGATAANPTDTAGETAGETTGETAELPADVPVVAMSTLDGVTINSPAAAEPLSESIRYAIGTNLVDAMIAIHSVDIEAVGLADLASHAPYAPRQLKRWSGQWDKTKTRELPALEQLTQLLNDNVPDQQETVLVHGDLHIGNIIVDPADGHVNGVVDWELATLGDPLADIGSLLAYWPTQDGLQIPGFEAPLMPGFPQQHELAERYLSTTGRSEQALAFWHVLGMWKVAIICEGVVRRVMNNPQNAAKAGAPTQEMVEWIVSQAAQTARSYGL